VIPLKSPLCFVVIMALCLMLLAPAAAENIDPNNDSSQYAYAENVGWLNAEPNGDGGDGVDVDGSGLSGYMWSESIGWISLSCTNLSSCRTVNYGVTNDGCGMLTGSAWGENVGWVNFAPTPGGVSINPQTGEFSGTAWGENVGWITFANDSPVAYGVNTSWRRYAPTGGPEIELAKDTSDLVISWSVVEDSDGYDVFQGSLTDLLTSSGDYSTATDGCLTQNQVETSFQQSLSTGTSVDFFLVRAVNCGGNGTSDSGGPGQAGSRGPGLESSGTCQ